MFSYTITIGRNFLNTLTGKTQALGDTTWATFEDEVNELLAGFVYTGDNDVIETHHGVGVWEGVREESSKVTLLKDDPLTRQELDRIREHLLELTRRYNQDAIALTIGESELIIRR